MVKQTHFKKNKNKEEGEITVLTLLRCYNISIKKHTSKKIREIN